MSDAGPSGEGPQKLVLATVGVGAFMSTLDGSVVNVSLPQIQETLGTALAQTQWVVMIYLLVMSALLLTFGRLGDLIGHRRVYLGGFFLFGGASFVCGAAGGLGQLVAGRAVQAVGAAAIQSVAPALLTRAYPITKRGRALGWMSLFTYAGLTIGPSVGGYLTTGLGWRSIFYVNLPVAALALAMGYCCLPREEPGKRQRFDLAGAGLWGGGLGVLLLAISWGSRRGFDAAVVGAAVAALVVLAAFLKYEWGHASPMIDLHLFQSPQFARGALAAMLNYVAVFGIAFLTPFRLIGELGEEPSHAGLLYTAMPLAMAVCAPASGTLSDRFGTRWPAIGGMVALAAGLLWLRAAPSQLQLVMALGVCGIGIGAFVSPNTSAVLGAAPRERQGVASGVIATARTTGMVLGVAIAGSIYSAVKLVPGASPYAAALLPAVAAAAVGAMASAVGPRSPAR